MADARLDSGESDLESAIVVDLPGGQALFTTRSAGNLSLVTGPGHERAGDVRAALAGRLGLRGLCAGRQVHGTVVRRIRAGSEAGRYGPEPLPSEAAEADGQATDARGVGVMALTADCLGVALGSERAVAMVHAGWRGLAAGVLEEGVGALRELDGSGAISAVIGPAAGPCCYEVGPEVCSALGLDPGPGDGRRLIDLPAIAHERLLGAGVSAVEHAGACTICDERFFSARREGPRAGRQAGIAWLS